MNSGRKGGWWGWEEGWLQGSMLCHRRPGDVKEGRKLVRGEKERIGRGRK